MVYKFQVSKPKLFAKYNHQIKSVLLTVKIKTGG
jgi:hypothetical protein